MKSDDRIVRVRMVMIISVEVDGKKDAGFQELVRGEGVYEKVEHLDAATALFNFERSLRAALLTSNASQGVRVISAKLDPPASKAIVISTKPTSPKKLPGKGGSGSHGAN